MGETLFGGGGNIPSNKKLSNLDIAPAPYKALRGPTASLLGGATSGTQPLTLAGIPAYPGATTAGMTPYETNLLNTLYGRAGEMPAPAPMDTVLGNLGRGATPLQQAGTQNILDTLGGRYLSPESNPFLAGTIKAATDPITQNWERNVMPNLRIGFSQAGQTISPFGSSPFDRATAMASNDYLNQIANTSANLAGANYQNERQNQLAALGLGNQATGLQASAETQGLGAQLGQQSQNLANRQNQTAELIQTLQSTALPRLIEQHGLDQGIQEYRNRLATLMQVLGMQVGVTGTSIAPYQSQAQQGQLGGVLAGFGSIAQSPALTGIFGSAAPAAAPLLI